MIKLLKLAENTKICDLYFDTVEMLKKGEVDQFRKSCKKTAELAVQIHQQMAWDQTSDIYRKESIQRRWKQYNLNITGFYNHIHLIRLLVEAVINYVRKKEEQAQEENEKQKTLFHDEISKWKKILDSDSSVDKIDSDSSVDKKLFIQCFKAIQDVTKSLFDQDKRYMFYKEQYENVMNFFTSSNLSAAPLPGVITFLDVLGWKGIYQRKADAISHLQEIISMLRKKAEVLGFGVDGILDTEVLSISDTIVISTRCLDSSYSDCIDYHGVLCAGILLIALEKGIPLRGAVCCGKYAMEDNIFVGPAVDEAASWHELADWIGICMSPSAAYHYPNDADATGPWMNYTVAFKDKIKREVPCLKWKSKEMQNVDSSCIREILRTRVPIFPEVSNKYDQTCAFLEYVKTHCPDDVASSHQEDGPESL